MSDGSSVHPSGPLYMQFRESFIIDFSVTSLWYKCWWSEQTRTWDFFIFYQPISAVFKVSLAKVARFVYCFYKEKMFVSIFLFYFILFVYGLSDDWTDTTRSIPGIQETTTCTCATITIWQCFRGFVNSSKILISSITLQIYANFLISLFVHQI